jgi:GT2 family glycosyltransferase
MSTSSWVDVIIPSYNGREHLERCLPTLLRQDHPRCRVIVVDNGSRDGTIEWLRTTHPGVTCVPLDGNRGFSGGVNAGIRSSNAEFIALLNNDTVVAPGWISELVRALEGHPDVGFCTSKILSLSDPSVVDNAGDGFGRKGISYPIGYLERDEGQYDHPRRVFGACGAACVFRRRVIEKIGLFDEDFFAYHEDVDLSFRLQLAGFGCLYVPTALVYHAGSATSGSRINPFTVYLSTRNNLHVLVKNLPGSLAVRYLPWLVWGQAYWFLKMAVKEGMWGPWVRGILAGVRQAGRMLRKRRSIRRLARLEVPALDALIRSSETEIARSIRTKRRHLRQERRGAGGGLGPAGAREPRARDSAAETRGCVGSESSG